MTGNKTIKETCRLGSLSGELNRAPPDDTFLKNLKGFDENGIR